MPYSALRLMGKPTGLNPKVQTALLSNALLYFPLHCRAVRCA
jgi:hypothetical protein